MSRLRLDSRTGMLILLGLLLLLIQGTAIWGVVESRRRAEQVARLESERSVAAQAATLEAALATLYGDLRYFVHSWAVADAPRLLEVADPVTRRWSRLDLDGAALLFLEGHPAVARIHVESSDGDLLTAVGWRQGWPVILRSDEIDAGAPEGPDVEESVWRIVTQGRNTVGLVRIWIDRRRLLRETLPTATGLRLLEASAADGAGIDPATVAVPVTGSAWQPPLDWTLQATADGSRLSRSLQPILTGFRRSAILNVVIIAASALLGWAVLRQTRRAATAEAELRHGRERQELERQVQHNERLAAVGRLAAGVAHEINNPLSGVVNYLSLLDRELDSGDLEAASELTGRIREGVDRASEVVHQVLTFAEPGSGEHRALDLVEVCERTFAFVATNPAHRHLELTRSLPESSLSISGDAAALSQLVLNLLLNACDLQPEAGSVDFRLSRQGSSARIEVLDRGPGLSDEALAHLFEPFYSTRGSTGLGLAVCHGIVLAHGGSIEARNRSRGGARLVVDLPLAAAEEAASGSNEERA